MARRKFRKEERRLLKRAGFGREFKGLGGLAVALEDAKFGARPAGYVQQADSCFGERTRRRVRRERWNKRWRAMRRFCLMVAVYGGSLVVFLLSLGAAVWQVLYCVWPSALVSLGPLVPLVCAVALGMVYVATHLADEEGGR